MKFGDRNVVVSDLDKVPNGMRVSDHVLVMTRAEAAAVSRGDTRTIADLEHAIGKYERAMVLGMLKEKR